MNLERKPRSRFLAALFVAAVLVLCEAAMSGPPAGAQDPRGPVGPDPTAPAPSDPGVVVPAPVGGLPPGDSVVVGQPSAEGLLVLLASAGAPPEVVANLRIDGLDTTMWTGTVCRTGSGRLVAATFAPVELANDPVLRLRGAFAAVIDLEARTTSLLPERVSLSYHSPGCGPIDEVAFARYLGDEGESTQLLLADGSATITETIDRDGHLTSPAPGGAQVFAATASGVVALSADGAESDVALPVEGSVFDLHATGTGTVDFLELADSADELRAMRADEAGAHPIASGLPGELDLVGVAGGQTVVAGAVAWSSGEVPTLAVEDPYAAISASGSVSVSSASTEGAERGAVVTLEPRDAAGRTTGPDSVIATDAAPGDGVGAITAANVSQPWCVVPRNDPNVQVMQPSAAQVEWAVNLAVRNQLTVNRPAGWNNNGLGAYTPQGLFERVALHGGGQIPAQVLLGVLAQESNLQQAAKGALPGVAANPKIADYYGTVYDSSGRIINMDYDGSDCGYGIGQVTTGMSSKPTAGPWPFSAAQQKAIATDYAANIAAAHNILAEKWNQLFDQGLLGNGGDPSKIESWYFAAWGYNSSVYPAGSPEWGLGWTNNPANTDWKPDRSPFLRATYDDAKFPYLWPYQELVMGWAENGQFQGGQLAYSRPTYASGSRLRLPAGQPPGPYFYGTFCTAAVNSCSMDHEPNRPANYVWTKDLAVDNLWHCTRADRRCWWHGPSTWGPPVGTETAAFLGQPEPTVANPHPPACQPNQSSPPLGETIGILNGAVIVDDVATGANIVGCPSVASAGTFAFTYGTVGQAQIGAIDTHQIGAGFRGHFSYADTTDPQRTANETKGTWTPPTTVSGWTRIVVHIPDHGADTYQAAYKICFVAGCPTSSKVYTRTVNQRWNRNQWVDLGIFNLPAGATVSLSNFTSTDFNSSYVPQPIDIAWDAVAFVPSVKPKVAMVSLGDSYSSGEGVDPYTPESDVGRATPGYVNDCHRATQAYGVKVYGQLKAQWGASGTFHSSACSRAVMSQVSGTAFRSGEVPQLAGGWLDENTTVVTVSIGGNDVGFTDVLVQCAALGLACTIPQRDLDAEIDAMESRYLTMLQTIGTLAPNVDVVLVGYPNIITDDVISGPACLLFPLTVRNWMVEKVGRLDGVMERAVATAEGPPVAGKRRRYYFVDPRDEFATHEACGASEEWINPLLGPVSNGSGLEPVGFGSFHPKASGHTAYASAIGVQLPDTPPPPPAK